MALARWSVLVLLGFQYFWRRIQVFVLKIHPHIPAEIRFVTSRANILASMTWCTPSSAHHNPRNKPRILVLVTIYHGLLIGRDGHLVQSEAYDIHIAIYLPLINENIALVKLTPLFGKNVAYAPSSCTLWIRHCNLYENTGPGCDNH